MQGETFSASIGTSLELSAAGVPHGMIRFATAKQIREAGGKLEYSPEIDTKVAKMNWQHVHVIEGGVMTVFSQPLPNPVPKRKRFGGPDYFEPGPLSEGGSDESH